MNPLRTKQVYSWFPPRGIHTIKIWYSEKEKGKYSFSIAYGNGVMSKCNHPTDAYGQFGQFTSIEEAIEAATKVILKS